MVIDHLLPKLLYIGIVALLRGELPHLNFSHATFQCFADECFVQHHGWTIRVLVAGGLVHGGRPGLRAGL
jgi:hypothetical protein